MMSNSDHNASVRHCNAVCLVPTVFLTEMFHFYMGVFKLYFMTTVFALLNTVCIKLNFLMFLQILSVWSTSYWSYFLYFVITLDCTVMWNDWLILDNKWKWCGRKWLWPSLVGTEETTQNFSLYNQGSQCPGQHSNWKPLKHKSEELLLEPTCSVTLMYFCLWYKMYRIHSQHSVKEPQGLEWPSLCTCMADRFDCVTNSLTC